MHDKDQFINNEFIPWPDYAICPNCKEKVDLPKDWNVFRLRSKKKQFTCPNCEAQIDYIDPGKFRGPPFSTE
jgi:transcription initiation factor IIE alpha subunit